MAMVQIPEALVYRYQFEYDSGCYQMIDAPPGVTKLPPVCKVEPTQAKDRIRTKYLIRGRHGKWDRHILTGLATIEPIFRDSQKFETDRWFYGDHFTGRKNFLLFWFSPDNHEMKVYYFPGYYPVNPTVRRSVMVEFIYKELTNV